LRFWNVFDRDLTGEGARARDDMVAFLEFVETKAQHYEQRRVERMAASV
jgi:acyl-[acyl-carrier-protein] desaturase